MRIKMRLLRHVPDSPLKGFQVKPDLRSVQQHGPGRSLQQSDQDLDGSGFPGAVRAEIPENFSPPNRKADIPNHGNPAVSLREPTDFKHADVDTGATAQVP